MFPLVYPPKRDDEAENMKALSSFTPFGMPSVQEWQDMWAAWDYITLRMIPPSMLFQKPIDLRHICLFYCGHIPTFLSIHLSKMLGEPDTEPVEFKVRLSSIVDVHQLTHNHLNSTFLRSALLSLIFMDLSDESRCCMQRGIDPNVDDPTQCHVSAFFALPSRIHHVLTVSAASLRSTSV